MRRSESASKGSVVSVTAAVPFGTALLLEYLSVVPVMIVDAYYTPLPLVFK
jgi:hypothetical protein